MNELPSTLGSPARLTIAERLILTLGLLAGACGSCFYYLRAIGSPAFTAKPLEFALGLVWGVVYPLYVAAESLGRSPIRLRGPWSVIHNPVIAIVLLSLVRSAFCADLVAGSATGFAVGMAASAFLGAWPTRSHGS